jgi:hypothetical protein
MANVGASPGQRMTSGQKSLAQIHIDACFACRLRLPIVIGDSVDAGSIMSIRFMIQPSTGC